MAIIIIGVMIMNHDIKTESLTCPLLWVDWHLEGWVIPHDVVFHHPMGNIILEHNDHVVAWTFRGFLV